MDRFEYFMVTWATQQEGYDTVVQLSALGARCREAVGITSRMGVLPMPGMGATVPSDTVVVMKRRVRSADDKGPS